MSDKRLKYVEDYPQIYSKSLERDHIEEAATLLSGKFDYFYSHLLISETITMMIKKNFAAFYSGTPESLHVTPDILNITVDDIGSYGLFFDTKYFRLPSFFAFRKVLKIKVNSRDAGYYFPEHNILLATDWVHDINSINVLKKIADKLPFEKVPVDPKSKFKITIGADPEFELTNKNSVIYAGEIIENPNGTIGLDGARWQVELRPTESTDIDQFVKNFKDLLQKFHEVYRPYRLSCLGNVYPLGGHIHIGAPFSKDFIKILDNWIGIKVIDLSGEARLGYKKLSAFELKLWGFEYRTPPSAIFHNEKVLKAVLKIIKTLAEEFYFGEGVLLEPTEEEIKRLGLEKEFRILDNFVKSYRKMQKDILVSWGIARSLPFEVSVVFRDDWAPATQSYFRERLVSCINQKQIKKLLKKNNISKIIIYGFREDRGLVCDFDSEVFQKIDFVYPVYYDQIAFGLPYRFRMKESLDDNDKAVIDKVIDEIINEIIKKLKGGKDVRDNVQP